MTQDYIHLVIPMIISYTPSGIMPIMTYGGFKRMTGFCKTKVPQELADKIESLKDDEEGLKVGGYSKVKDKFCLLLPSFRRTLGVYQLERLPYCTKAALSFCLQAFGIEQGAEMCRKLLAGGAPGLHMYSLNLEATVFGILERIGFIEIAKVPKALPWKHIPIGTRRQVSVYGESTSVERLLSVSPPLHCNIHMNTIDRCGVCFLYRIS